MNAARKGKTKPVVTLYNGLSPDHWKFTYSAVKEILIRLIIVFTLASTELSEGKPPTPQVTTVTEKVVKIKKGQRKGRGRTKRKINRSNKSETNLISTGQIAFKIESDQVKMDVAMDETGFNNDLPPSPLENLGNDCDWL